MKTEFRLILGLAVLAAAEIAYSNPLDTWIWWNPIPPPVSLRGIVFGDNQFVAVGDSGIVVTSTDGTNWNLRSSETQNQFGGIAYGNGQFVAVGYDYSLDQDSIVTSTDGLNWVHRQSATQTFLDTVVYGNGKFVAAGEGGSIRRQRVGTEQFGDEHWIL